MNRYKASFNGRTRGAIGVFEDFKDVLIDANSSEEAREKLYNDFDHISRLTLRVIRPERKVTK